MIRPMPDPIPATVCQCYLNPVLAEQCECPDAERALRAWTGQSPLVPAMTPEQREWCLSEIDSVEGYRRSDYESDTDAHVARGVLDAWTDFCRDKGLL